MKKAGFLSILFAVTLLAVAVMAEAQQGKVYYVGVLTTGTSDNPHIRGLRDGLKEAGYVEGKNLVFDTPTKDTYEELRPVAKAYIEKKFDVIITTGGTATLMAKGLTTTTPIVFVGGVRDPIASGLVSSVARPDANVTGFSSATDFELHGKRLQTFKEVVPALKRVAVFYNARGENPGHAQNLALIRKVAPSLGLTLAEKPIKLRTELEPALSSISKDTTGGIFVICSSLFAKPFQSIIAAAAQKRLPLIGCSAEDVSFGALVSYDADRYRLARRGAWYVDRILKGAKPTELPIETPNYFELVINLKTAKQIGVTIPQALLYRADKVIK